MEKFVERVAFSSKPISWWCIHFSLLSLGIWSWTTDIELSTFLGNFLIKLFQGKRKLSGRKGIYRKNKIKDFSMNLEFFLKYGISASLLSSQDEDYPKSRNFYKVQKIVIKKHEVQYIALLTQRRYVEHPALFERFIFFNL